MVVKTDLCNFSEWKIYPGKGVRFVAKDGRPFLFLSKRNRNFSLRKIKAQRLRWATAWRRLHKKIKQTDASKAKRRRDDKRE